MTKTVLGRLKIRLILPAFLGGVALLLSGCVTAQNVGIDKATGDKIRKIAIMPINPPRNIVVLNMGGGAMAFGAIGGMLQGVDNNEKSNTLKTLLDEQGVRLGARFASDLQEELAREGLVVSYITDQKPKLSADGRKQDFSGIHTDADALMVVSIGAAGYVSPPSSSNYEPWVAATVVLFEGKTKKVMYSRTFSAGFAMKVKNDVHIPMAPKFKFDSFDALTANIADGVDELYEGDLLIARQVAQDMKGE